MFSCFLILIFSLIISISDKSIIPSLLASKRVPFANFSSNFSWIKLSSIELASIKSLEASANSFFSSSVFGLSEIPVSIFAEITWSVSYKVWTFPSDEILIVPTSPKLSSDKPTSLVPSGLIFILNLVPLIPRIIVGNCISIEPSWALAIFPDSIITLPFLTIPKNFFFSIEKTNSVIVSEDEDLIMTVELSSYWIVADDLLSVTISSNRKISS